MVSAHHFHLQLLDRRSAYVLPNSNRIEGLTFEQIIELVKST